MNTLKCSLPQYKNNPELSQSCIISKTIMIICNYFSQSVAPCPDFMDYCDITSLIIHKLENHAITRVTILYVCTIFLYISNNQKKN